MRSGVYGQQPSSRAMSMTAASRPNRPASLSSRANSLTASSRAYQRNPTSRLNSLSGSRVGSRTNSLRANSLTPSNAGNSSHTKIIKTTKETDYTGRTKSITTTTIEKRGNMKIVRTTVIHPSDQRINEDAELEELAELEDFDHDGTVEDYPQNDETVDHHEQDGHFGEYEYGTEYGHDYRNTAADDVDYAEDYNEKDYYEDPNRNGAALAAAVALNSGNQKRASIQHSRAQVKKNARQSYHAGQQRVRNNTREVQHSEARPEVRFGESEIVDDTEGNIYSSPEGYQNEFDDGFHQQEYQSENAVKSVKKVAKASKKQKSKPFSPGATGTRKAQKNQAIAAANSPSSGADIPSNRTRKLDPPNLNRLQQSPVVQRTVSNESNSQGGNVDVLYANQEQQISTPTQSFRSPSNNVANDLVSDEDYDDKVGPYNDEDEEEVMVVTPEMSISESFKTRAQKRLSEIAEVTETYDDDDDDEVEQDQDFMEEPILNPLGIDTAIPSEENIKEKRYKGRATLKENSSPNTESRAGFSRSAFADNVGTTNSSITSDDNFVEASEEILSDPPATTNIYDKSGVSKAQSQPLSNRASQKPTSHTYRNLLFNDSKRSPIKNSIPTFNTVHNDYANDDPTPQTQQRETVSAVSSQSTSPVAYQNNFKNFDQQEDELYTPPPEKQPKKLKLKSALKNSSSSLASPVSETNPQFAKYGGGSAQRNRSQTRKSVSSPIENPRKELTPEEMYALALKAAEKKVYGDRLATVYPDNDIDDDTKLNTIVNMQAPQENSQGVTASASPGVVASPEQGYSPSQPGVPYQSNAAGLGFRVHSLRDGNSSRQAKNSDPQEASRLKRFFKHEQKQQRRQWEEERKAATDSELVQKAAQKVEKEVSMMPVNPDVELYILQQQEQAKLEQSRLEQLRQQQQVSTSVQEQAQPLRQESISNGPPAQLAVSQPAVETEAVTQTVAQQPQHPSKVGESETLPQQPIQTKSNIQPATQTNGTTTANTSSPKGANEPSSPNKLRLKMFSFGKKKSTSDNYTHQKQASVVSEETQKPTASVNNKRGSVDGKKSKFFSFGLGGSHDVATTPSQEASKIQKLKTAQPIAAAQVEQTTSVSQTAPIVQTAQRVESTPDDLNARNVQSVESAPKATETESKGLKVSDIRDDGVGQNVTNGNDLSVQNVEKAESIPAQTSTWSTSNQPLKAAEITTIPEIGNDMSAPLEDIQEEKFSQPTFPGVHSSGDNFVRGPHGSFSNLTKVGTVNSSVTNGSAYTGNNFSAGNLDSVNPTDSSKLASNEAQNLAFSAPVNGGKVKAAYTEIPDTATAQVIEPQSQVAETSSTGRKAGKSPKAGRKFMKFFNL